MREINRCFFFVFVFLAKMCLLSVQILKVSPLRIFIPNADTLTWVRRPLTFLCHVRAKHNSHFFYTIFQGLNSQVEQKGGGGRGGGGCCLLTVHASPFALSECTFYLALYVGTDCTISSFQLSTTLMPFIPPFEPVKHSRAKLLDLCRHCQEGSQ